MEFGSIFKFLLLIIFIVTPIIAVFFIKDNLNDKSFNKSNESPNVLSRCSSSVWQPKIKAQSNSAPFVGSFSLDKEHIFHQLPFKRPSVLSRCSSSLSKPKTKAEPNSAPFVASFLLDKEHIFDGVIIDRSIILTACHNVTSDYKDRLNEIDIYAGQDDNAYLSLPEVQKRKIKRCEFRLEDDLALVYVGTPFIFTNFVNKISLPKYNICQPDRKVVSFSFGPCCEDWIDSTALHAVKLKIMTAKNCFKEYGIENSKFCACDENFDSNGPTFFCYSDSGSPLIKMIDDIPTLAGVFLGGKDGCSQRSVVFQNIFFFKEWIIEASNILINA